jgi:hypothetical protein
MPTKKSASKPSKAKRNGHAEPVDQRVTHSIDLPPGVEVVTAHLSDFQLDPHNLNDHTPRGHSLLTREIEQNGIGRGTFATRDGVIKAGNLTTEVVGQVLGDVPAIVVRSRGDVQVIHQRMDLDSTDERAVQMGIADNWIGFTSLNLNADYLRTLDPSIAERFFFADELTDLIDRHAPVPSLDDLASEYGEPHEEDFWPIISVKVSPKTHKKYLKLMGLIEGKDDSRKFSALLGMIDESLLGG